MAELQLLERTLFSCQLELNDLLKEQRRAGSETPESGARPAVLVATQAGLMRREAGVAGACRRLSQFESGGVDAPIASRHGTPICIA